MGKLVESFKPQFLEGISNGKSNCLVTDSSYAYTCGSVSVEAVAICYEMTQFNVHVGGKFSLHELAMEINKERYAYLAVASVESICHSFGFILRHEMEANARTYEKVRANLIAVCGADFKATKFIVANSNGIAEISKAAVATVVILCLSRETCDEYT
ncbi:MAG: hypothetical protein K2G85_01145 [Muribaculaceae bacterium]|nr:hypothetical protein [Muribaculaceae bacterium]